MSSNQRSLQSTAWYAIATLALTSLHHAYGAYIFSTPWRLDAVYISAVTSVVILGSTAALRRSASAAVRNLAAAVFVFAVAAVPVLFIGAFEAFYNHVVKNIVYFGGASADLMSQLFPPPMYELPNDLTFEITGVLQVVPAIFTTWNLFELIRSYFKPNAPQLSAGANIAAMDLRNILGQTVSIPDESKMIHLQFRRFAGCPVCDLHLRSFTNRAGEIAAAGIREVVIFHSSVEDLLKYEKYLPFDVVADPRKDLYGKFGVESSARALTDPRVWIAIVRAVMVSAAAVIRWKRPLPPIAPEGGSLGLPADFLIDSRGRLVASKYGMHANDQWSVDEVFELCRSNAGSDLATQRNAFAPIEPRAV